jgi:glycosyltransferase involved in cell wall biosynthesis
MSWSDRTALELAGPSNRRLRVAHISLGLNVGGQERLLVEFARLADRDHFDLIFVSLTDRGRLADVIEGYGWPVLALNERPGFRPGMIWRLSRLLRARTTDIVHTHDDRPLLYGSLASKLARVRRLIHTHHHGYLASIPRRRLLLLRGVSRIPDEFVCVSHDSARFLREQGVASRHVKTVWNGVDLDQFSFTGPRWRAPALTVARLSPEKDIANLLRAVAQVARAQTDFRLDIAGDGPCRDELESLAAELKLTERVRFLGEVRDVAKLLGQASMFVLPSQTEGISLTILEAMARGLPVLATKVGGNPEIIMNGTSGILVPPGNPSALAHGILELWANEDRALQLGRAARHRIEEHFDVRAMVAAYEALYASCRSDADVMSIAAMDARAETQPIA